MTETQKGKTERTAKGNPELQAARGERSLAGYQQAKGEGLVRLSGTDKARVRRLATLHAREQHAFDVASGRADGDLEGALDNNTSDW